MRHDIKHPQVRPSAASCRDKDKLVAIRREGSLVVVRRVVCQPFDSRAVRMYAIEIRRSRAL
jgi:hypothetical protein